MPGKRARPVWREAARKRPRFIQDEHGTSLGSPPYPRCSPPTSPRCGQAWADFDVYMPDCWARDLPRRRAAGIPEDLAFATKPQLAIEQVERLIAAGLPVQWAAADEVYGRSEELPGRAARPRLSYVGDHPVRLPGHPAVRHGHPR